MRVELGLAAGLLALAGAVSIAASSPPDAAGKKTVTTHMSPVLNAARRPNSAQQSSPAVGTAALTAAECTSLGGRVHDAMPGVCKTNQFCSVTDNFGHTHAVCLSAQ